MTERLKKTYIDGEYGQIHCRVAIPDEAPKAPIVCLHMSPKSGRSWADVLPLLATNRIAIAPDYPGHGESDKPPAEPHVTVDDFARNVWMVIDAFGGGPVHLVGCHTGSMVAVEASLQRPDDVLSIVSFSAPVFTDKEIEELATTFAPVPIDEQGTRFRVNWERVMENRSPGVSLQMLADSFAENLRAGDDYEWGHRAAFAYAKSYRTRLGQVRQPILVINPADDCYEASLRADSIMQNGRRIDRREWGHGFMNAYPKETAKDILDFVEQVECDD